MSYATAVGRRVRPLNTSEASPRRHRESACAAGGTTWHGSGVPGALAGGAGVQALQVARRPRLPAQARRRQRQGVALRQAPGGPAPNAFVSCSSVSKRSEPSRRGSSKLTNRQCCRFSPYRSINCVSKVDLPQRRTPWTTSGATPHQEPAKFRRPRNFAQLHSSTAVEKTRAMRSDSDSGSSMSRATDTGGGGSQKLHVLASPEGSARSSVESALRSST